MFHKNKRKRNSKTRTCIPHRMLGGILPIRRYFFFSIIGAVYFACFSCSFMIRSRVLLISFWITAFSCSLMVSFTPIRLGSHPRNTTSCFMQTLHKSKGSIPVLFVNSLLYVVQPNLIAQGSLFLGLISHPQRSHTLRTVLLTSLN